MQEAFPPFPPEEIPPEELGKEDLIEKILRQGGFAIHTSFPNYLPVGEIQTKKAGLQTLIGKRLIANNDDIEPLFPLYEITEKYLGVKSDYQAEGPLQKNGVFETFLATPFRKKRHYIEKTAAKKLIGSKTTYTPKEEMVQPAHNEVVTDGTPEPAWILEYSAWGDPDIKSSTAYLDFSRRTGNIIKAYIVLPESTAKEAVNMIKLDPKKARVLTERILLEKMGVDRALWDGKPKENFRTKPPYDAIDQVKGKMLIAQADNRGVFLPENIKCI
jgi:hypothetical protein